ncbi:iron-containing alcohol dehydrogenase [Ensifer canadensis]
MMPFSFSTTKSVVFRRGAARDIDAVAGALLGPRILLVTDPGVSRLGLYNPALEALRRHGKTVVLFDAVEADPSVGTLQAACALGANSNITGVLGFGGGSSLDVAKVASLLLGSKQPLDEAWGVNNAKGPRLPLVLVPTTAGTGSEVTPVAILTLGGEEKRGISSPVLLPDIALLDAELTLGLPPQITAATGIDAMVHAIEAYTSANANNNPLSRILAREALRLLGANIERAVSNGLDIAAREAMLLGSMWAGQAFANSPVAAVHALAYPIGGIFHVPHGLSNALVLTSVMRFNLPAAGDAYAEIAADVFPDLADAAAADRASAFVRSLGELILRLQMPSRLRELGIPEDALPRMALEAMKQQRLLVNNPRSVSEADALAIYSEAW